MANFSRRDFLLGAAAAAAMPSRPSFASGGVASEAALLGGEAGPESVVPDAMALVLAAIVVSVAVNEVVRAITTTVTVR